MNFVINSTKVNGQTLTANVTYTLANGYVCTIDVAIFQPKNLSDVEFACHSRGLTVQSQKG